jgi:PAS domain S-box-containing protein
MSRSKTISPAMPGDAPAAEAAVMQVSLTGDEDAAATTAAAAETQRLQHEIGVHQAELELQNEQLREAQAALEKSRDRYVDLYEHAPVGYVTFGLDGVVADANGMARRMLAQASCGGVPLRLHDCVAPDDRGRFHSQYRKLLRGGEARPIELRLLTEGRPLWVEMQMTLVDDDNGRPQCRAALTDVSERVAMQSQAWQLAAIVASSDDAIVSRDLDGIVTSWNDGARRLFGYTADEMIGRTMDALVPPERRDEEEHLLARLRSGDSVAHHESDRLGRGHVVLPVSISLSPIRDERRQVVGSSMIARDVSHRRRADRLLHQRLRQLDLLSRTGQLLILSDKPAVALRRELFESVRAAVGCEIHLDYGASEDGRAFELLSVHGVDDAGRAALARADRDNSPCGLAAEGQAHVVLNHLQATDLPQARTLKSLGVRCYAGFPLLSEGRVHGIASFASTTRDAFAEGDLQVIQTVCDQVSAMLERSRLTEELHAREQSLRRADRAKDDFIATLAHELRNPLAPIRNAVSIMRHGDLRNPQQLAWCRDIIDRQVGHMSRLLEDLLDIGRLTRNRIELRRERMDLMRAIDQALETTHPLVEARGHSLALDLPAEPVFIHGDAARLTQVFVNLLTNAAKYTDRGGRLSLSVHRADDSVRIAVRDSGIGIAAADLPRVFEMFAQLEPALDRSGGGLGIGLALARGLVEMHGGTMSAHSDGPGQGSEFIVHLPIHAVAQARNGNGHDAAAGPRALMSRRLLVVDDNVDAAQTLALMLGLHGQDVRTAYGGVEALEIAEGWHPEVAVLDIGMSDMNGYELCRRIRACEWGRQALLIACTGWGQTEDRARARAAGFDVHLVKPIEPSDVLDALARLDAAPGAA